MQKNFLRMSYLNPYIIWGADCILSLLCSLLSFLFYHYLINVSVDVELLHHFLWVAFISGFVWTGVCKTFRGIIR